MTLSASSVTVALANGATAAMETHYDDSTTRHSPTATLKPSSLGGYSTSRTISAASTNATNVKATAGQLYKVEVTNINAAVRYLKLYDKATAPASTDTPKLTYVIPGGSSTAPARVSEQYMHGIAFSAGIGFRLVTGLPDNDDAAVSAEQHVVHLGYV